MIQEPRLISIGKLAKATGFAVERLRMWELRYGAPKSQRLPSGHRRYAAEEVERLHLVAQALAKGKRPRHVVALERDALVALLAAEGAAPEQGPAPQRPHALLPWTPKAWASAVQRRDPAYLERQFYEHWLELGSLRFLAERVEPYLHELGSAWKAGDYAGEDERWGTERLADFLAVLWSRLNEHNAGAPLLVTTLPGEPRSLEMQAAALAAAMAGLKVSGLHARLSPGELAREARRSGARAVYAHVTQALPPEKALGLAQALRAALPQGLALGFGGPGAPQPPERAWALLPGIPEFHQWTRSLAPLPAMEAVRKAPALAKRGA